MIHFIYHFVHCTNIAPYPYSFSAFLEHYNNWPVHLKDVTSYFNSLRQLHDSLTEEITNTKGC